MEQDKQSTKTVPTWVILAIVGVIAIGIFAVIAMQNTRESYVYNGFEFTEARCPDGDIHCWETTVVLNIGIRPILFYYGPKQTEDVLVDPAATRRVLSMIGTGRNDSGKITIAFDEGSSGEVAIAGSSLSRITGDRVYNIPTKGAVYGDVTCDDAENFHTIIYIKNGTIPGVRHRLGCIVVEAPTTKEIIRVADAFTYHLLGIQGTVRLAPVQENA